MTSATTGSATGAGGRHAEGHGYGLVLFASVLLVIVGFFNLIYGIAAIANSHVFTANAHYVFGSLRTWGCCSSWPPAGYWPATRRPAGSPWPSWG